jgi:hypothetical protein
MNRSKGQGMILSAQDLTPSPQLATRLDPVIFTSDLLKVDDRLQERLPNPQLINIEWLYELFAPLLTRITGRHCRIFAGEDHPNPLARLSVYRRLQREFSSAGWASIYQALDDRALEDEIAACFAGALVISFELPPFLESILRRHDIGFIDLAVHPVRYLPDYMFAVRSNIQAVSERMHATQVPPAVFADAARLSAARSRRVYRNNPVEPGSAVFLGQIEVDASLIHRGRLYDNEDVEAALVDLSTRYQKVYYKAHPHRKDLDGVRQLIASMPRCQWLDVNVYDLLSRHEIEVVASLSSGTLVEAGFFGRATRSYIERPPAVDVTAAPHEEVFLRGQYVAAPPAIFNEGYWSYLLGSTERPPETAGFDLTREAFKTTLNMKWGR